MAETPHVLCLEYIKVCRLAFPAPMDDSDRGKGFHPIMGHGSHVASTDGHDLEKRLRRGVYDESQTNGLDLGRRRIREKPLKSGRSAVSDLCWLSHSALGQSSLSR